ncbi:hypothetical protein NDI39_10075 [Microcoleus sp. ZQ-A2]|nr:hypothetical protein [Microcoleus sp. FACHB-1]
MLASNYLVESRAGEALSSPALYSVIPKWVPKYQRGQNPVERACAICASQQRFAIALVSRVIAARFVKNDKQLA